MSEWVYHLQSHVRVHLWVWCFWIFHFACEVKRTAVVSNIGLIYCVVYTKPNHTSFAHTHAHWHKRYYATRASIRWKIPKWKCVHTSVREKPNQGISIEQLVCWQDASSFRYCSCVFCTLSFLLLHLHPHDHHHHQHRHRHHICYLRFATVICLPLSLSVIHESTTSYPYPSFHYVAGGYIHITQWQRATIKCFCIALDSVVKSN